MGYTKKEKEEINTWLVHVGALSDVDEPFEEFKKGQLLEIARAEKDSIMTWDEWQHLQNMLGMEVPLEMACAISGMLYENASSLWTWKQKIQRRKSRWTKDVETACITGMTGTQESSPAAMSALTITVFQLVIMTAAKTGRKNKKGKEDGRQDN